ncbi:MAG: hypothetical protein ABW168_15075 [Sedimenticola sp.]
MSSQKLLKRPHENEDNEVDGYLHEVSPIKMSRSNNRYFNAKIQTDRERYSELVCFDIGRHPVMKTAAEKLTPVKLQEIREVPSQKKGGSTDILVNHRSILTVTKHLKFQARIPKPSDELEMEIKKIKNIAAFNKVSF